MLQAGGPWEVRLSPLGLREFALGVEALARCPGFTGARAHPPANVRGVEIGEQ